LQSLINYVDANARFMSLGVYMKSLLCMCALTDVYGS